MRTTLLAAIGCGASAVLLALSLWLGFTGHAQKVRANGLDAEINAPVTGYRDRLSACQASRANLEATVEAQNRAVETIATEAQERQREAQRAIDAAKAQQRASDARVRSLLRQQPSAGETACQAADRIILENAG